MQRFGFRFLVATAYSSHFFSWLLGVPWGTVYLIQQAGSEVKKTCAQNTLLVRNAEILVGSEGHSILLSFYGETNVRSPNIFVGVQCTLILVFELVFGLVFGGLRVEFQQ